MSVLRILHLWIPPAAVMALLFLASSTSDLPSGFPLSDKLAHLAAYTVLGLLLLRAFHGGIPGRIRKLPAFLAVATTVAYGALDEFHQRFVHRRFPEFADFTADLAGALLALLLLALWVRFGRGRP